MNAGVKPRLAWDHRAFVFEPNTLSGDWPAVAQFVISKVIRFKCLFHVFCVLWLERFEWEGGEDVLHVDTANTGDLVALGRGSVGDRHSCKHLQHFIRCFPILPPFASERPGLDGLVNGSFDLLGTLVHLVLGRGIDDVLEQFAPELVVEEAGCGIAGFHAVSFS